MIPGDEGRRQLLFKGVCRMSSLVVERSRSFFADHVYCMFLLVP